MQNVGSDIRRNLLVTFISEHGIEEAGIDQGGLTKEFLEEVVYASFDLERGLMAQTEGGLGFPHAAAGTLEGALSQLRLLGLLLGKALLEGILLDVPLAHFFITFLQVGASLPGLLSLGPGSFPTITKCTVVESHEECNVHDVTTYLRSNNSEFSSCVCGLSPQYGLCSACIT